MNTKHKLTELQKIEVRAKYKARRALPTVPQMAEHYGVSTATLYSIINDDYERLNRRRKVRNSLSITKDHT